MKTKYPDLSEPLYLCYEATPLARGGDDVDEALASLADGDDDLLGLGVAQLAVAWPHYPVPLMGDGRAPSFVEEPVAPVSVMLHPHMDPRDAARCLRKLSDRIERTLGDVHAMYRKACPNVKVRQGRCEYGREVFEEVRMGRALLLSTGVAPPTREELQAPFLERWRAQEVPQHPTDRVWMWEGVAYEDDERPHDDAVPLTRAQAERLSEVRHEMASIDEERLFVQMQELAEVVATGDAEHATLTEEAMRRERAHTRATGPAQRAREVLERDEDKEGDTPGDAGASGELDERWAQIDWERVLRRMTAYAHRRLVGFGMREHANPEDLVQEAVRQCLDPDYRDWTGTTEAELKRHLGSTINGLVINLRRRTLRQATELVEDFHRVVSRCVSPEESTLWADEWVKLSRELDEILGEDDRMARGVLQITVLGIDRARRQAEFLAVDVRKVYQARRRLKGAALRAREALEKAEVMPNDARVGARGA